MGLACGPGVRDFSRLHPFPISILRASRPPAREDFVDSKREEMIVKNLPLVTFVVGRMSGESGSTSLDREDAIAYGIEGLIQAVDNYDPERGTTFASFAIRRIRGSILDAVRRMDVLPRSLRRNTRELERANLDLASTLGRWPTIRELAVRLNQPVEHVIEAAGHSSPRVVSLERMMTERSAEGSAPWEISDHDEYADPAAAADRRASFQMLDQALGLLSKRDKTIVQLRYGKSMHFHEIGQLMSLSESRVCQLHKRILTSLRGYLTRASEAAA
jgi:RNA polymerase sigma factor for flagellar operon FliA